MTGLAWFATGVSVSLVIAGVLLVHDAARVWDLGVVEGRRAGAGDLLAELDRLLDLDPSMSADAARDHLDAIYTRAVVEAASKETR